MKNKEKIIYSAASVAFTSILVYLVRKSNTKRRIREVSNEGYETAADMLHPKTNGRFKNLRYGPVLPEG